MQWMFQISRLEQGPNIRASHAQSYLLSQVRDDLLGRRQQWIPGRSSYLDAGEFLGGNPYTERKTAAIHWQCKECGGLRVARRGIEPLFHP